MQKKSRFDAKYLISALQQIFGAEWPPQREYVSTLRIVADLHRTVEQRNRLLIVVDEVLLPMLVVLVEVELIVVEHRIELLPCAKITNLFEICHIRRWRKSPPSVKFTDSMHDARPTRRCVCE